ncbi:hypothetical protein ACO0QE_002061 [Hanseniaspora vineae]
MAELHVWWDYFANEPSVVSPESVALCKYINHQRSKHNGLDNVTIIGSNNLDIFGGGFQLPLLVVKDETSTCKQFISGFLNIVLYLEHMVQKQEHNYSKKKLSLQDKMLLNYLCNKLTLMTEYQLFLNLDNYKNYTKLHLFRLFPFPFNWLNDPLRLRKKIEQKLNKYLKIGYVNEEEFLVDESEVLEDDEESAEFIAHDEEFDKNMKKYLFDNKKENQLSILKYHTQFQSQFQRLVKVCENQAAITSASSCTPHISIQCLIDSNMDIVLNKLPNSAELKKCVPSFQFSPVVCGDSCLDIKKPNFKESNYNLLNKFGVFPA